MNRLYLLSSIVITTIFSSCSFYSNVNVRKAVDINPEDVREVKNVVILNRTAVPQGSKVTNVLEGVITGEVPMADRNAADKCVNGLKECLQKSLNYQSSQLIAVRMDGGSTTNVPPMLSWEMVDSLCKMYNSDMLVSLDFFDSNSGVSLAVTGKVPLPQSTSTNDTKIKTTWRVYNRLTRKVVDEFTLETYSNSGHYKSPYFMANTVDKYNIVNTTGYWAGIDYGFRISEQFLLENRVVFSSGSSGMKSAGRLARAGLWEDAMKIWDDEAMSSKRKVRQRAQHNMAVYYERIGDLQAAADKARNALGAKYHSSTSFMLGRIQKQIDDQPRLISANK